MTSQVLKIVPCLMALLGAMHADHHPWHPVESTTISSSLSQRLFPGEAVHFEKVETESSTVNLTYTAHAGLIIFNRAGTYKISWSGRRYRLFLGS